MNRMFGTEFFADIRRAIKIPELFKKISKQNGIGGPGKYAGKNEAPPLQFADNEFRIGLFSFFCANCGKIPAGFLIFESDIILRTITTKENREGKYNKLLIKEQRTVFHVPL